MQLIKPVLDRSIKSFEVTEEATDKHNEWLQSRLAASVWTDCTSYYQTEDSKTNFVNWPGPLALLWWMTLWPRWESFKVVGGEGWEKRWKGRQWALAFFGGVIFAVIGAGWRKVLAPT